MPTDPRKTYDVFPVLSPGPFNQPRLPSTFADKTKTNIRDVSSFVYQRKNGLAFVDHPMVARIHHNETIFKPMLLGKGILLFGDKIDSRPISPVGDVCDCVGRQTVRQKLT